MSIASQITTMQEHIEDIYDTFAVAGVDTSAAAKNIVNINANLKERLEYYLANGLDVVWNNWNKISGSGTTLSLNNTIQAKMDFVYKGNTSQSILPSGYTQVDYITSDGNSYIDTGKALGDNFKIETKFIHNQQSNDEQPIISTWVNGYAWFNLYIASNNQLRFYAAGNHMTANPTLTIGNINTVSYSRNDNEWVGTLNGEKVTFNTDISADNLTTFKIFSRGDNTLGSYVSIYRLKLFENNILTMDLIPCYRNSDNVIGMYDIVNNIFYTNSGTGSFTYGSVAPTPECPIPVNVVTGDNEVKVEGKNIGRPVFDSGFYILGTGDNRKVASRVSDKCGEIIKVKPSTNYTISGTFTSFADSVVRIALFDAIPVIDSVPTDVKNTNNQLTFTTGTNTNYVLLYDLRARSVTADDLFVCETQYASTYEPYQSQTYPINLGVKNLIDLINFAPIGNNTVVSLINNGINVNNTSGGYGAKIQLTDLKANTDYYISYNWKNISNGANRVVVFAGTGTSATLASFNNLNGGTFNTGDNTTINIWFYAAVPGIAEVEYTNIQLEEGTVKHSYTPSWFEPIELRKIGDYQDYIVKSTGKNLVNSVETHHGINGNTGAITTENAYLGIEDYVSCKPNTTYTISFQHDIPTAQLYVGYKDKSGTYLERVFIGTTRTFTTPNNAYYMFTYVYYSNNFSTIGGYVMLNKGTTALPYEPYGTGWYKYSAIGKVVLDGSESWNRSINNNIARFELNNIDYRKGGDFHINLMPLFSNYFSLYDFTNVYDGTKTGCAYWWSSSTKILLFGFQDDRTLETFKTWLSTHNTIVYYVLNTPTITKITDTTLISQLEAIKLSYNEQTNISQTNTDKPFILDVTALKDLDAEDTTSTLTTNQGLLFTQPPVSENFINDEDDNSILEETINEEEPNIEDDNREEEEPLDFFEKEIINNDEEQEEIPTEPIEIDNGQR